MSFAKVLYQPLSSADPGKGSTQIDSTLMFRRYLIPWDVIVSASARHVPRHGRNGDKALSIPHDCHELINMARSAVLQKDASEAPEEMFNTFWCLTHSLRPTFW